MQQWLCQNLTIVHDHTIQPWRRVFSVPIAIVISTRERPLYYIFGTRNLDESSLVLFFFFLQCNQSLRTPVQPQPVLLYFDHNSSQ